MLTPFDTATQTFGSSIALGIGHTGSVSISSDGQYLYVNCGQVGPNNLQNLAVVGVATNAVLRTITFPFLNALSAYVNPVSQLAYIVSEVSWEVSVIDTKTGSVTSTFTLQYVYTDPQGKTHSISWRPPRLITTAWANSQTTPLMQPHLAQTGARLMIGI